MMRHPEQVKVIVHAISISDALGYRGQHAVAQAVATHGDYRIIGGQMVRMLLHIYPTTNAVLRSTLDTDAGAERVQIIGPITQNLIAAGFVKQGGNVYSKAVGPEEYVEINLLLSRSGATQGIRPLPVANVGQIDTLPELSFALATPPLVVNVEAHLENDEILKYQTRIPDLETAVVLKAHSWQNRRAAKDLADLHSLLEIRDLHPQSAWQLNATNQRGFRKDSVHILNELASRIIKRNCGFPVPSYLNKFRFAALIERHIH